MGRRLGSNHLWDITPSIITKAIDVVHYVKRNAAVGYIYRSSVMLKCLPSRASSKVSVTVSTSFATTPWQAASIEMPGDRRSWTVLRDEEDGRQQQIQLEGIVCSARRLCTT